MKLHSNRRATGRIGALLLALLIPLVGGRVIYHCAISGQHSFACCCAESVDAGEESCCFKAPEDAERDAGTGCNCCDIRVFTIDGVTPSPPQLVLDDTESALAAWPVDAREPSSGNRVESRPEGDSPPPTGPLYILHLALLT